MNAASDERPALRWRATVTYWMQDHDLSPQAAASGIRLLLDCYLGQSADLYVGQTYVQVSWELKSQAEADALCELAADLVAGSSRLSADTHVGPCKPPLRLVVSR